MNNISSGDDSKNKHKFYGTKLIITKEENERGNIDMTYVNTSENIADMLTKPLAEINFRELKTSWMH